MDNFDDLLRRAMEAEQRTGDEDGDEDVNIPEEISELMGVLSMGNLVKLGRAAKDKQDVVIKELMKDLNTFCKMDEPSFHAHASFKISETAKKLHILNIIISSCAISSGSVIGGKEFNENKTLDMILKLNLMR